MKVTYLQRNRRNNPLQRHAAAEFVYQFLLGHPCVECSEADPLVLQFDHRGEKTHNIGWFVSSGSPARRVAEELDKCDVRCANCHRRRTAKAREWFRAGQRERGVEEDALAIRS